MCCDLQSNQKRITRFTDDTWEEITRIKQNAIEDPLAFRNIEPDPHRTIRFFRDLVAFIKSRPQRAEDKRGATRPIKSTKSHENKEKLSKQPLKMAKINEVILKSPQVVLRDIMQWEECPGKSKGQKLDVTCELAGVLTVRYYRVNQKFTPRDCGFCSSCHVEVGNVSLHKKKYHTTGWTCQICHDGVVFYAEWPARNHLFKYHGRREGPNETNMSLISTKTIRAPMKQCPICGYSFRTLKTHLSQTCGGSTGFTIPLQAIGKLSDGNVFNQRTNHGFCAICGVVVNSISKHRARFHTVGWKCQICLDDTFFYAYSTARQHLIHQHNCHKWKGIMTEVSTNTKSIRALLKQCPKCNMFCKQLTMHICVPGVVVDGAMQVQSNLRQENSLRDMTGSESGSFAMGHKTASKPESVVLGGITESKTESGALGDITDSKTKSFALGGMTESKAESFALGGITASKYESVVLGDMTESRTESCASGDLTASKTESVVLGKITASETKSFALGDMTATKTDSFALGERTTSKTASKTESVVLGKITASETKSFALGDMTATKTDSFALGERTTSKSESFALGERTASKSESVALVDITASKTEAVALGNTLGKNKNENGNFEGTPLGASEKTDPMIHDQMVFRNNSNKLKSRIKFLSTNETDLDSVVAIDCRGLKILDKNARILDCGCSTAYMQIHNAFLHDRIRYRYLHSSELFCSTGARKHDRSFLKQCTAVSRKFGTVCDKFSIGLGESAHGQDEVFELKRNEKCAECDQNMPNNQYQLLHRLWRYQCLVCCQIFCHRNLVNHLLEQHNFRWSGAVSKYSRILYKSEA